MAARWLVCCGSRSPRRTPPAGSASRGGGAAGARGSRGGGGGGQPASPEGRAGVEPAVPEGRAGVEPASPEGRAGVEPAVPEDRPRPRRGFPEPGPRARYPAGRRFPTAPASGRAPRAAWSALPGPHWPDEIARAAATTAAAGRGALIVVPDARDLGLVDAALAGVLGPGQHVCLAAGPGPPAPYRHLLPAPL